MNGHIKLDRKIMDWQWWNDEPVFKLWITILLLANWEEKNWHGKTIPRGSFWTSIASLSKKSGLSPMQVRTALKKLEASGEITSNITNNITNEVTNSVTNSGRLITVVNYGLFQDKPKKVTNKITNNVTNNITSNVTTTEEERIKNKKIWGEGGIKREYI